MDRLALTELVRGGLDDKATAFISKTYDHAVARRNVLYVLHIPESRRNKSNPHWSNKPIYYIVCRTEYIALAMWAMNIY